MKKQNLWAIAFASMLAGTHAAQALTIVIDLKSAAQGNTTDNIGYTVGALNYAGFGFTTTAQQNALDSSILQTIRDDYYNIPTKATLAASPIAAGFQLNVDFVLGDIGVAPSNGDSQYYYAQVGTKVTSTTSLGIAGLSAVRTATGLTGFAANHATVCSIFSDNINALTGLTPTNALTTGNLTFSTYGIGGTLAHEIGHTLSLSHINKANSVQPNGLPPLMGTGAIDLPNNDRIGPREFSLSGFDGENGNAPRSHIAQLVTAVGLRAVPEPATLAAFAGVGLLMIRRVRRTA